MQGSATTFLASTESGWLARPLRGAVGEGDGSTFYGLTVTDFNSVGDAVHQAQNVAAATALEFGGDTALGGDSPGYTYEAQVLESSSVLDAFGNVVQTCGGANVAGAAAATTACLRFSSTTYDTAYAQLPLSEASAVELEAGGTNGFRSLTTAATWERGLGALLQVTDPNAQTTDVGYDGLGRKRYIKAPDSDDCTSPTPQQQFTYVLADETNLPVSYVMSYADARDPENGCVNPKYTVTLAYVDGLGRPRGSLLYSPEERAGEGIVGGVTELDARGQPRVSYDPRWISVTDVTPSSALTPSSSVLHTLASYDPFGRPIAAVAQDGSVARMEYHGTETWSFDPNDDPQQNPSSPQHYGTPTIAVADGQGRAIEQVQVLRQPGESLGSARYLHLVSSYRADGNVIRVTRAETTSMGRYQSANVRDGHVLQRDFFFDTAGRRVTATDPDSDSRSVARTDANRHWRYLFNSVGDLAAVRDPRGCGQDFFYDRGGRLVGEDYVRCSEAQVVGESYADTVSSGIGLVPVAASRPVDVRYYYDVTPSWASAGETSLALGRATGSTDRAQRSAVGYDRRGNAVWNKRQMAIIALDGSVESSLSGDSPEVETSDEGVASIVAFDALNTYVERTQYDAAGRPFSRVLPTDPDWARFGGGGSAPEVRGELTYNTRGLPSSASVHVGLQTIPVLTGATYDAYGAASRMQLRSTNVADAIVQSTVFDNRHRPHVVRVERGATSGVGGAPGTLNAVAVPFQELYDWDRASNLVGTTSQAGPEAFVSGRRQVRRTITQDSLNRVAQVSVEYLQADLTWGPVDAATDWRDERTRTNADSATHREADPMASTPAPRIGALPANRVVDLLYEYDWLANMTTWEDDARSFHERSIGELSNGADTSLGTGANPALRPSALYVASNIRTDDTSSLDRAGWLDLDYGESGNVVAVTVRAECANRGANTCTDNPSLAPDVREAALLANCVCAQEQHFQYRWDELNRLSEARRYDRDGGMGGWDLVARQRYRYDAGNVRTVKQTIDPARAVGGPLRERIHLYVYPGDFERVGVEVASGAYIGNTDLGTETEYHVAGTRVVWKAGTPATAFERKRRVTYPIGDLLGTASAVVDLDSGELVEMATFHPNGGREMHWTTASASYALERNAFTSKEEDEEVGLVYFGERYLMQHAGRWATPDPLSVHSMGGGEAGNSYHFVDGNLLEGTDPDGLCDGANQSCTQPYAVDAPAQRRAGAWGTVTSGEASWDVHPAAAADFQGFLDDLDAHGIRPGYAGGVRNPSVACDATSCPGGLSASGDVGDSSASRAPITRHTVGGAIDTTIHEESMRDPSTDLFVVSPEFDKTGRHQQANVRTRVYARSDRGEERTISALVVDRGHLRVVQTTGRFEDVTQIAQDHGIERTVPRQQWRAAILEAMRHGTAARPSRDLRGVEAHHFEARRALEGRDFYATVNELWTSSNSSHWLFRDRAMRLGPNTGVEGVPNLRGTPPRTRGRRR